MSFVFINCTAETFTPTRSGGICSWVWGLAQVAQREGIEPWVITKTSPDAPYPWPKTLLIDYPVIPRNRVLSKLFYLQRDLTGWGHVRQKAYNLRVAAAIQRDGLHHLPLLLNNDIELAVFLRRRFPKAVIFHQAHNRNPCREKFRRQFKASIDTALAVSDDCGRWNKEFYGLDTIQTVYPGVDAEAFYPAARRPDGPPLINFVGRTDALKGTDLLLLAAKKLSDETKNFRLQILGSNHYGYSVPDEFQTLLQELSAGLERDGISVRRPGFVDRYALPDEMRRAHINVVPSRWDEPFGLVTPEGMASGLATVASRTGGTPEIIGDAGLLFERGDVDGLAAHLSRLVGDADLVGDYGRRGRARAQEFTWEKSWARLKPLLKN
jgi:glycosyltransferase involved in cell wall biosynthesis